MNIFRQKRKELKLSQTQLAIMLEIDRSTIAKWETGESMPRAALLPKLAEILKCSIDDLFRKEAKSV